MKLLLWTESDPASSLMARALREAGHFGPGGPAWGPRGTGQGELAVDPALDAAMGRVEGSLLDCDFVERRFEPPAGARFERALFLSKHSARSGVPALTVHSLGNIGPEAPLGGRPRTLSPSDPVMATRLLQALGREGRAVGLAATFEATHHGPLMEIPSLFVEVGSRPEDWQRPDFCAAAARAVLEGYLRGGPPETAAAAIGLGGGHYHARHTDAARAGGVPMGHLIPAHALEEVEPGTLKDAARLSGAARLLVDPKRAPEAALRRARSVLEAFGLATTVLGASGPSPQNL